MTYATVKQFAEKSGLGLRILDEVVGTGNSSETDFDLDHDNIQEGTYVLSAATSGSNTFTALTETTHYTLDKESGKIVLTSTGVTALGTKVLYATYWYTDAFSSSVVSELLAQADDEINLLTGRNWGTAVSAVEYHNGVRSSDYPTTDEPYERDYDSPDFIITKNGPITKIDNIFFLAPPIIPSKVFNYDSGTAAFTDKTTNAQFTTESPFTMFDDSPDTGDIIYIGENLPFLGLNVVLSTVGVSTNITWEYYNGTTWSALTVTDEDSGASDFTSSGRFTFSYPYGWSKVSVNSVSLYWVRARMTNTSGTDPICSTITIKDTINNLLETSNYHYDDEQIIYFNGTRLPDGNRNVRIDYSYGYSSVPTYISTLSVLIAAIKAFVNLSGGSYDAATSYRLGSKEIGIGEQYVNIKTVLEEFRKEINRIMDLIGTRADIIAI